MRTFAPFAGALWDSDVNDVKLETLDGAAWSCGFDTDLNRILWLDRPDHAETPGSDLWTEAEQILQARARQLRAQETTEASPSVGQSAGGAPSPAQVSEPFREDPSPQVAVATPAEPDRVMPVFTPAPSQLVAQSAPPMPAVEEFQPAVDVPGFPQMQEGPAPEPIMRPTSPAMLSVVQDAPAIGMPRGVDRAKRLTGGIGGGGVGPSIKRHREMAGDGYVTPQGIADANEAIRQQYLAMRQESVQGGPDPWEESVRQRAAAAFSGQQLPDPGPASRDPYLEQIGEL